MTSPARTHDYSGHHLLDPDRWDRFAPRRGDIVVSTPQKAGTTLVQTIIANLIFPGGDFPAPVGELAPWLDMRLRPFEPMRDRLAAQTHRRSIKTHLPLNGLTYYEQVKYVVVGRDARDAFMSLLNHHRSYSPEILAAVAQLDDVVGRPFPAEMGDARAFWRRWITESWFGWESDGYPYWSHHNHIQSWWDHRTLDNVHFVHFADILADPRAEIARLAAYLDLPADKALLDAIARRIRFEEMKKNFDRILPEMNVVMRGGGDDFMHRGTNGRWRALLDEEDLRLYRAAVDASLSPDCARWLEGGRAAFSPAQAQRRSTET